MDIVVMIDTLINLLVAICAGLTALAILFLAIRPLLDPHWRDARKRIADNRASLGDHG